MSTDHIAVTPKEGALACRCWWRRGRTFFQVVYFLPVIIATVITARVWQGMIYSPVTGLFGLLQRMGILVVNPLSQPSLALFGVATVDLWHW